MKYLFLFIITIVLLMACRNRPDDTASKDRTKPDKRLTDTATQADDSANTIALHNGTHCFAYIKNRDTISMQLVLKDTLASGNLVYNFYEKDKNSGTFKGFLRSDTLLANYTFSSEGTRSVRQVVFLVKGNILLSGSGSMKEQNDRLVFSNKSDISFDGSLVLKPADCGTLNF